MTVEVYIKNQKLDAYEGVNYSMTKQVNEFTELRTRQWSYTNKYRFPKTARNRRIFDFLSYPANTSQIAYERIEGAQLYFNGVPVVTNGYAMVDNTKDDYNVVIYDGTVVFFEAIKNLTLRNLDWSDLDHQYGEGTMEASFSNTSGYIYPIARTSPSQPLVYNYFDVPSPSIYLKDIVQKIAAISGVAIEGSLLSDSLYQKAVVTTEKGIRISQDNVTLEASQDLTRTVGSQSGYTEPTPPTVSVVPGYYKIDLDYEVYGDTQPAVEFKVDGNSTDGIILTQDSGNQTWYAYGSNFEAVMSASNPNGINTTVILYLKANKINYGTVAVQFADLVHDTKLSDFMKQVMTLFCVNIYPEHKENKVKLDFINDLDSADTDDLSQYLQEGRPEEYQIGPYGSINDFKYKLDENQDDESEGSLLYSSNKGERRTHFTSNFYQPYQESSTKYRNYLFDEDFDQIDAKPKIFAIENSTGTIQLTTVGGIAGKSITGFAYYDFEPLRFYNIIPKYYTFLQDRVFKNPLKIDRTFALPVMEFFNLDFRKLYYLKQEQAFFYVNKIKMNSRGLTNAELIKIEKKRIVVTDPVAVITGAILFTELGDQTVQLLGTSSYSQGGYIDSYNWVIKDEGEVTQYTSDKNNIEFTLPEGEIWEACLTVTNEQGRTNERCVSVESRPPVESEPDTFSDETLILSDACYTLKQFKVNGSPNGSVGMNVKSSIINGKSNLIIWDASANVGMNCQVAGCPLLGTGQIILPKLGPGVNEISYTDELDLTVSLDGAGEAYVQMRIEGVKDEDSPIDNGTFVTIKDNANGQSRLIIQRYWAKTTQCDSF